jgi:hypothetical protein
MTAPLPALPRSPGAVWPGASSVSDPLVATGGSPVVLGERQTNISPDRSACAAWGDEELRWARTPIPGRSGVQPARATCQPACQRFGGVGRLPRQGQYPGKTRGVRWCRGGQPANRPRGLSKRLPPGCAACIGAQRNDPLGRRDSLAGLLGGRALGLALRSASSARDPICCRSPNLLRQASRPPLRHIFFCSPPVGRRNRVW